MQFSFYCHVHSLIDCGKATELFEMFGCFHNGFKVAHWTTTSENLPEARGINNSNWNFPIHSFASMFKYLGKNIVISILHQCESHSFLRKLRLVIYSNNCDLHIGSLLWNDGYLLSMLLFLEIIPYNYLLFVVNVENLFLFSVQLDLQPVLLSVPSNKSSHPTFYLCACAFLWLELHYSLYC